MSAFLDKLNTGEALERLKGAPAGLRQLREQMANDIREARSFTSEDFTADGLRKHREQLVQRARDRYEPQLQELQRQARVDAEAVERFTTSARPKLADDAVALQRAQMKWEQVRTRLDAGMTLQQVLRTADQETVLAVSEWGPSWMEAQAYSKHQPGIGAPEPEVDLAGLTRTIDERLAEVSKGDASWAIKASREAAVASATLKPLADHAQAYLQDDTRAVGNSLAAALESHYAGAEAGRGLIDSGDDGSDGDSSGDQAAAS